MNIKMRYDGKELEILEKEYEIRVVASSVDLIQLFKDTDKALAIIAKLHTLKQVSIIEIDDLI